MLGVRVKTQKIKKRNRPLCSPCSGAGHCMVGSCMGEISTGAQSVARTPMYALAGNCRFCPADPMKKAPTAVLNPLHHCWGPNWHKTTLKKDSMVPHVGTLADDLSCPVQPPSLVMRILWITTRLVRPVRIAWLSRAVRYCCSGKPLGSAVHDVLDGPIRQSFGHRYALCRVRWSA